METGHKEMLTDVFLINFSSGRSEPLLCDLRSRDSSYVKICLQCVHVGALVCAYKCVSI